MKLPTKPIEKIYISIDTGTERGAVGFVMEVFIDLSVCTFEHMTANAYLESIRDNVGRLYTSLHDGRASVLFDFECDES